MCMVFYAHVLDLQKKVPKPRVYLEVFQGANSLADGILSVAGNANHLQVKFSCHKNVEKYP